MRAAFFRPPLMVCRQTIDGQWMGDQYICRLLVLGMNSRIRSISLEPEKFDPWFADILSRKPSRVAAIARSTFSRPANVHTLRIINVWITVARGGRPRVALTADRQNHHANPPVATPPPWRASRSSNHRASGTHQDLQRVFLSTRALLSVVP